jgi:hypothetical protein
MILDAGLEIREFHYRSEAVTKQSAYLLGKPVMPGH